MSKGHLDTSIAGVPASPPSQLAEASRSHAWRKACSTFCRSSWAVLKLGTYAGSCFRACSAANPVAASCKTAVSPSIPTLPGYAAPRTLSRSVVPERGTPTIITNRAGRSTTSPRTLLTPRRRVAAESKNSGIANCRSPFSCATRKARRFPCLAAPTALLTSPSFFRCLAAANHSSHPRESSATESKCSTASPAISRLETPAATMANSRPSSGDCRRNRFSAANRSASAILPWRSSECNKLTIKRGQPGCEMEATDIPSRNTSSA
mmetsp:Transcript_84061/g.224677  ORF Transcript_84061/g.224677 Transcript_84061/m.224677 type:complete len:265 (-) Transcript_84061:468-1262(-)